jgi:DNA repair exonuclease SbcCD ATPase subunit
MPEHEGPAEPQHPVTEEAWHDKALADAIAYTRSLVTLLDSLTEAFRRRGRELAEVRARLEILQGERRKIIEERAVLEERFLTLDGERDRARADLERRGRDLDQAHAELKRVHEATQAHGQEIESLRASLAESSRQAERLEHVEQEQRRLLAERTALEEQLRAQATEYDGLRTAVRERDAELEQLRAESARTQGQLGVQAEEVRSLQAAVASASRQAEELREIVRGLERERDTTARRHAARVAEADQARERAGDEARAAREALAQAGQQLETARRDVATLQARVEALRVTSETERLTLTAERDAARRELEERQQAFAAGQEELTHSQQALAAEGETLRERDDRLAELGRLTDELEGRIRSVEAEGEAAGSELARLSAEAAALSAARADAVRELAQVRDELAESTLRAKELEAGLDRARAEAVELAERARVVEEERTRLGDVVEGLETVLARIAVAMGQSEAIAAGSGSEADPVARWQPLADDVRAQQDSRMHAEAERDALRATVQAAQELVGPAASLPDRLRDLVSERQELVHRVEALAREDDAQRAALAEATQRARIVEEERDRLAVEMASLRAGIAAESASPSSPVEAPAEPQSEPAALAAPASTGRARLRDGQPAGGRRAGGILDLRAILFLTGEVEGTGDAAPVQVTGQVSALNHAGMVIALEQSVPTGQAVAVRLLRRGGTMVVRGTVVRTQDLTSGSGTSPTLDHLIRFEHPEPESAAQLKAFLA